MQRLIGYYDEQGYSITDIDSNTELYIAGNSPFDSHQEVGVDDALSLETIKEFCESTLQEMAEELSAKVLGVEYRE